MRLKVEIASVISLYNKLLYPMHTIILCLNCFDLEAPYRSKNGLLLNRLLPLKLQEKLPLQKEAEFP